MKNNKPNTQPTKLLTIPEYARSNDVSAQSVYSRIRKGKLKVEEVNNQKMIRVTLPETETQDEENQNQKDENLLTIKLKHQKTKVRDRNKIIKKQEKEIEHLRNRIEKLENKIDTKEDYINKIMNSIIPLLEKPKDYVDAEIVKKKKKKKRKQKV